MVSVDYFDRTWFVSDYRCYWNATNGFVDMETNSMQIITGDSWDSHFWRSHWSLS